MSQIMSMAMSSMTVTVSSTSLQSRHEREAQYHSQSSNQSRHSVLGQFVTREDLKERDVEQSSGCQALEDSNQEDMLSRCFLHVNSNNDTNQDAKRSIDTEEDDVDDDLDLLDPAGDHVRANTEDDGNSMDGDRHHKFPDSRVGLLQAHRHPLKQAVDGQGDNHQETSQVGQNAVSILFIVYF